MTPSKQRKADGESRDQTYRTSTYWYVMQNILQLISYLNVTLTILL